MFAKIVLVYLVIACAAFVWVARIFRDSTDNEQWQAATRMAPKSMALILAALTLIAAAFWPATLTIRFVFGPLLRRAAAEANDDDDDDGMPQEA